MADQSAIEWTDATWNPLRGCSRVSAGCQHCYAEKVAARFSGPGLPYEGLIHPTTKGWNGQVKLVPEVLDQPLRWKKPRRIFVNSMSDLFHESVPDNYIAAVFGIMAATPKHTYQVLTKRPMRMQRWFSTFMARNPRTTMHECVKGAMGYHHPRRPAINNAPWPLPNVWLGVSVENQETADERIPLLLQCQAAVRWLSCEPLLGQLNLGWYLRHNIWESGGAVRGADYGNGRRLDWIVAGGESGTGARPMHPGWVGSLRDQCAAAGVPFFFKQWGEWEVASAANGWNGSLMPDTGERFTWLGHDGQTANPSGIGLPDAYAMARCGKRKTGRLFDGIEHNAYPKQPSA